MTTKANGRTPHPEKKRLNQKPEPDQTDLFPHGLLPYVEEQIAQSVEQTLNVKRRKRPFREHDAQGMIHPKMSKKCRDAEKLHKARGGHK